VADRRSLRICGVLVVVMAALNGAQVVLARLDAARLPRPVEGTPTELLTTLTIAPEAYPGGYRRDQFGDTWATGPDGCDTRSAVLRAESVTPAVVEGCTVVAGQWVSVYDAARVNEPAALDIDHLVPLAEAWASDAADWTDQQRRAFANDLDPARPDALVAVTASANRAKGDSDPAEWMPPDPRARSWYVTAWITQKAAWHLSIDPAEHQALTTALADCTAPSEQRASARSQNPLGLYGRSGPASCQMPRSDGGVRQPPEPIPGRRPLPRCKLASTDRAAFVRADRRAAGRTGAWTRPWPKPIHHARPPSETYDKWPVVGRAPLATTAPRRRSRAPSR
jgi:hypothetical protein